MKDLLVVFTEGVDRYNLEKQLKNFKESTIIRLDNKPDYFILYEQAIAAYESGYDSFHYLTESEDWAELDSEFKKEFYMFESAGVIKGNYGKSRLIEANQNNQEQPLIVIFPANYASFNGEAMKQKFAAAIQQLQHPMNLRYLILPLPFTQNQNKSVGLTAGEAFELFEDITKHKIKECFPSNNIIVTNLNNPQELLGIVSGKNPIFMGPTNLASRLSQKLAEISKNQNLGMNYTNKFHKDNTTSFDEEYNQNLNQQEFTNILAKEIANLKSQSLEEPMTEQDTAIINNIGDVLKTDKDRYVNQCFNISIYNITNNIDITNNTQINVTINEIYASNGIATLGQVADTLLDINGNLEATQGTIYNSAIKALRYGAQRTFTQRDRFDKAGAEGKAAFNKMTGNIFNVDDSYETDRLNKRDTLEKEVNNISGARAKANQDARLSKMNIADTNKKIELLKDKKEKIENQIESADENEKKKLEIQKKEIEQELANSVAQLNAYTTHQTHNQQFGDVEKIKQIQHNRDNGASGLNGAKYNQYSNMGQESDKSKVQKAKNIKEGQELNQKMNAKLLTRNPKTGTRPLDDLKKALA